MTTLSLVTAVTPRIQEIFIKNSLRVFERLENLLQYHIALCI